MKTGMARNGEFEIAYESFGCTRDRPMVLIPGSGMQLVGWPDDLCRMLADRGFHVARMDNRDSGLSTRYQPGPDAPRRARRRPYDITDMADDVIAVADALGGAAVHLVGTSLGATIAEVAAIHHPGRVGSLTLQAAAAGSAPWLNRPRPRTALRMMWLMRGVAADAAAEGQRYVDLMRLIGSPAYPTDEEHWRAAGELSYQRGGHGAGAFRHTAAYLAARDLRPRLAELDVPTLVVHGAADPLQSWRASRITADVIPGARFLLLPKVGHVVPMAVWPTVIDEIVAMAERPTAA